MKMNRPPHKGVQATLYIDGKPVAGQLDARLNRTMSPITITNKIKSDWSESLGGVRNWSLTCNGLFVKSSEALSALESAFYDAKTVEVKISNGDKNYSGTALITNFPVTAAYNDTCTYSITLLGTGALQDKNDEQEN